MESLWIRIMSEQPEKPRFDYSHLRGADAAEHRPAPTVYVAPTQQLPARPIYRKRQPQNWMWVVVASVLLVVTIIGSVILAVGIRYYRQQDDTDQNTNDEQ